MEIARLEVSTQQHLDRMQETAKVNYVQYGKSTKSKKGKKSTQSGAGANSQRGDRGHGMSYKPSGKGKKLPFPQDTCYRCGKGRHQKVQDCKAVDTMCRGCGKKGHFEKVCLKGKHSTHSLEVPQASTSTAGAGASEPLYFDDGGQPVYTYMVSVPHVNKHLIKFPIALDYLTFRDRTGHSNCTEDGAWHMEHGSVWYSHTVYCPPEHGLAHGVVLHILHRVCCSRQTQGLMST